MELPMSASLLCIALLVGQTISLQDRQVVHLPPHRAGINQEFNGKRLELINAPAVIYLPKNLPENNAAGVSWSIDIRNFGPRAVDVVDQRHFSDTIRVGETVHILWSGTSYIAR
jgi:hypothetical protein